MVKSANMNRYYLLLKSCFPEVVIIFDKHMVDP
jgi:hypothetical protein